MVTDAERAARIASGVIQCYTESRDAAEFAALYTGDATFEDPLVHVAGVRNVAAQFISLTHLFHCVHVRLVDSPHFVDLGSLSDSGRRVRFATRQTFIPRCLRAFRLTLDVSTTLFLVPDPQAPEGWRVARHTDAWDLASLVSNIPLVGAAYTRLCRPLLGSVSSLATRILCPSPRPRPRGIRRQGADRG